MKRMKKKSGSIVGDIIMRNVNDKNDLDTLKCTKIDLKAPFMRIVLGF